MTRDGTLSLELLVTEGFVPTEVATVLDIVRIANRHTAATSLALRISTPDSRAVSCAGGPLTLAPSSDSTRLEAPDILIVAGGRGVAIDPATIIGRIAGALRRDSSVILLSDAATVWVRAGRHQAEATTHWEDRLSLREVYADDRTASVLHYRSGRVVTSAGMASTADALLSLMCDEGLELLANQIARSLVMDRIRPGDTPQPEQLSDLPAYANPTLRQVLDFMESNLSEEITASDIGSIAGVSIRQIERIFERHLGISPMQFLKVLRINRARHLMDTTNLPLLDIALAAGFSSAPIFSKAYRAQYGVSPGTRRIRLAGPSLRTPLAQTPTTPPVSPDMFGQR